MAESSSRLKTDHPFSDMDRLSNLPNNVVETVLERLPLRDVVRTKVLARAWRDGLTVVSRLVFDKESFPLVEGQTQTDYTSKLIRIISRVLFLHCGVIKTFELSVELTRCPSMMDAWIRYLSKHSIEIFVLDIQKCPTYKLPYSFFLIKGVTFLKLYGCIFKPPSSFDGYDKIKNLDLKKVVFTNDGLEQLLTLCPLLERLVLTDVDCDSLKINNQKLMEMTVECKCMNLYVESAPRLSYLCITLSNSDGVRHDCSNIVDLVGDSSNLQELMLFENTLQQMSVGDIPDSLPCLHPLRRLYININFADKQELLASFCIFRSSSVLEELHVDVAKPFNGAAGISTDDFWQAQEDFNCNFSRLKTVNTTSFVGTVSEMKFVEFILANAPSLERMQFTFSIDVATNEAKILKQLLHLPRSSAKAHIDVLE